MLDETDRAHVTHNTKEEMTKFEAGIIFLVYFVRRSLHSGNALIHICIPNMKENDVRQLAPGLMHNIEAQLGRKSWTIN